VPAGRTSVIQGSGVPKASALLRHLQGLERPRQDTIIETHQVLRRARGDAAATLSQERRVFVAFSTARFRLERPMVRWHEALTRESERRERSLSAP